MKATLRTLAGITLTVAGPAIFGTGCSQDSTAPSTTSTAQTPAASTASSNAVTGPPATGPASNAPVQSPDAAKKEREAQLVKQSQYWIAHGYGTQPQAAPEHKKQTEKPN